jgi:hypothetical protein
MSSFGELEWLRSTMEGFEQPWGVAGGWALSLFIGEKLREHADVEIALFRPDQNLLRTFFADWQFHYVPHSSGKLVTLGRAEWLAHPNHEMHASKGAQHLEILLNERNQALWQFRKNPSITLPVEKTFLVTQSGLPVLAPEIVLLFKFFTRDPRPKDIADRERVLPRLSPERRRWLERHTK